MRILGVFVLCIWLPNFSFSNQSVDFTSFSTTCPYPEANSVVKEVIEKCEHYTSDKLEAINKKLSIIDKIFHFHKENIVLIIADNGEDAINLSKFLTNDQKLHPVKTREEFKDEEKPMYDYILENVHLYKNPNESTVFFSYPRRINSESDISQILFEIIKHFHKAKFILTLPVPDFRTDLESFKSHKKEGVFRLFEVAAKIVRNVSIYKESSLVVVTNGQFSGNTGTAGNINTSDDTEKNNYQDMISKYSKIPDISQNGRMLAQYVNKTKNVVFLDGFTSSGYDKVITFLNKVSYAISDVMDYQNSIHITVDCWYSLANERLIHSMNSLPAALDSELSKMKYSVTTLTGVFQIQEKIKRVHDTLSVFLDCIFSNNTILNYGCFHNLGDDLLYLKSPSVNNFTSRGYNFNALMCMVQSWFHIMNPNIEYMNKSELWTPELRKYERVLKKQINWYHKLNIAYEQANAPPTRERRVSLSNLLQELGSNSNIYESEAMMKNAYNAVKSNAVRMKATYSCMQVPNGMKLQVVGRFLKLSKILDNYHCSKEINVLEIFALDKIFIDQDFVAKGTELLILIFSPVWEVFFNRTINLDGVSRNRTLENYLEPKARNGNNLNANGEHGQAGLTGGPAGSFYGLAETIINAENLNISLNGGNGSNGQDGGDGANGQDGLTASEKYIRQFLRKNSCDWRSYNTINFKVESSNESVSYNSFSIFSFGLSYWKKCYIYGLRGFRGGNGGNGGLKGKGGMAGEFKLVSLNGSIEFPVVLSASNGSDGLDGIGGKAGKGGFTRKVTMENLNKDRFNIVRNETIRKAPDGEDGKDGVSILGSIIPKEREVSQSFAWSANLYKRYVFSYIVGHGSKYVGLFKQVNMNKEILKTHDLLSLTNALIDLEEEYYQMKNKSHSLILYQSSKEGILDYFLRRREVEKTNEYRTVLRYLDNMMTEKMNRVQVSNKVVVFMLSEYLVEFRKQADILRNAKKALRIKSSIANFAEYYGNIKKMQQIVQEDVQREIDMNTRKFSGEIEMVLMQMAATVEKKKALGDALRESSHTLKNKFAAKTLNDVCAILNIGLGLINPSLVIIASKFSKASSQMKNLIDDSADRNVFNVVIPEFVKGYQNYFDAQVILRKEVQASVVETGLNLVRETARELLKTGQDTNQLDRVAASIVQLENMTPPKKDIVSVLDDIFENETSIWKSKDLKDPKWSCKLEQCSKSIAAISQTSILTRIKQMVGDLFPRLQINNTEILDVLGVEINKAYQSTLALRKFQEEVYEQLATPIEKMRGNPEFPPVTYLDLKNFEVDKFLKRTWDHLDVFINEFNALPSFVHIMRGFKQAIEIFSESFGRVQQHVAELKGIPHAKDLHFLPFDITLVKNAKLGLALTKSIQLSYANFVIDDYHKWMMSFKQYVFPFVQGFTGVFEVSIKTSKDLVTTAEKAAMVLNSYELQLGAERTKLLESGKIITAKFGYDLRPFHVWNSSHYSEDINSILSGKPATLFANISEHVDLNAIKFGSLGLRFRSSDRNIKEEDISRDLRSFAVKLQHSGDSHYRCDERVFVIPSNIYTSEKIYIDGLSRIESELLTGKSLGKYILSPYATWTIELVSRDERNRNDALKKYESKVNIELVGSGQFSNRNLEECKGDLGEYQNFEIF